MDFDYASRQIVASSMMAFARQGWEERLDRSVDGVFRSFQAILIAAPIALVGHFALRRAAARIPDLQASVLLEAPYAYAVSVELVGYIVDWAASLALLIFAARALGASRRVGDLVVAFNWTQIPIALAQTSWLVLLGWAGSGSITAIAMFPAIAVIIALRWGVIRRGAGANAGAATGLIALLMLTGVISGAIVSGVATALYEAFAKSAL